ncbi:hypothetical protein NDU88_005814 [Pleurodeles waltl]|uniref:Uncharacterized protein n=1 Tax=Pleurodeles waltl TaxID=8319 RepID=A0AAV7UJ73_PLEWA|nr:hypothetical protein NDU88_005814 [Pleurodeles waltl]
MGAIEASSTAVQAEIDAISLDVGLLQVEFRVVVERSLDMVQHVNPLQDDVASLKTAFPDLTSKIDALEHGADDTED